MMTDQQKEHIRATTSKELGRAFVSFLAARTGLSGFMHAAALAVDVLAAMRDMQPEGVEVPESVAKVRAAAVAAIDAFHAAGEARVVVPRSKIIVVGQ